MQRATFVLWRVDGVLHAALPADNAEATVQRLQLFRLRSDVQFEPLDDAVRKQSRLVAVLPMGSRAEAGAQVYLAESLAQWLSEQKVDGAGRPYGETKDEDPTLRKHFTRAQIEAIVRFGRA